MTLLKISVALISITLINLVILYFGMGVSLDKVFWTETLKSLFSNTLVFFIAIWCIDLLYKSASKNELKKINQTKSEFIFQKCTFLLLNLAEILSLVTEKNKLTEASKLILEGKVSDSTESLLNNRLLYVTTLGTKLKESSNKIHFLNEFIKTTDESLENLQKSIKDIYPHPSHDAETIIGNINYKLGVISASKELLSNVQNPDTIKRTGISRKDAEEMEKALNQLIPLFWQTQDHLKQTNDFFESILDLRSKAKNNDLFSVI